MDLNLKSNNFLSIDEGLSNKLLANMPSRGNTPTEESGASDDTDDKPKDVEADDEFETKDLDKDSDKNDNKEDINKEEKGDTKDDSPKAGDEEIAAINFLKEKLGVEDIEGEFDEDLDGIASFVEKVIEKKKDSILLEGQEELLTKHPEIKALKEHLEAGYKLDSFMKQREFVNWDKVVLKDDTEENMKTLEEVYRFGLQAKNMDEDEIELNIENAKDKGLLLSKAENAKTYLKKLDDVELDKYKAAEKAEYDSYQEIQQKFLTEAETILKSGKILGVSLNDAQIKELRKFSFEVGKDGKTEWDRKTEKLTVEQTMLLHQLVKDDFKGLGIKPKETTKTTASTLQKLKEQQANKKKIELQSSGEGLGQQKQKNARDFFQGFN